MDTDPARDAALNPSRTARERIRRALGREPASSWRGAFGFSAITEAWNSAVFASRHGPSGSMIVFGGGHNDYFGSSVHCFDLASREWRRLTDGYVDAHADHYGDGAVYPDAVYPDGSPLPPHTYDYVQYDPVGNDYLLLKGQSQLGVGVTAVAIAHLFNLDTLRWRRGPRHPTAILNSGGCTTWDASRRILWGHSGDAGGGNAFIGFNPDGANADGTYGRWLQRAENKFPGSADHNAMQLHPGCDTIVVCVHARDALYALNPAHPEGPAIRLTSSGAVPRLQPFAALQYSPSHARLAYFSATDRGIVHTIEAPAQRGRADSSAEPWLWRAIRPIEQSIDPIEDARQKARTPVNAAQVFGRFRIASYGDIDIAILIRHVDSPVYALRLPPAAD
jgi:hypothetical protein